MATRLEETHAKHAAELAALEERFHQSMASAADRAQQQHELRTQAAIADALKQQQEEHNGTSSSLQEQHANALRDLEAMQSRATEAEARL